MSIGAFGFRLGRFVAILVVAACTSETASAGSLTPLWARGGHGSRITSVACSPDGATIASASDDYTVKLWSTNGTLLRTLSTEPSPATAVAFSPDGTRVAIGTYFGGYASGSVSRFGYSSIPGLGLVYLWHASGPWDSPNVSLTWVRTNGFGKTASLAFSPDNLRLACGNAAGSNLVYTVANGLMVTNRPGYNLATGPAAVTGVAFSSKGWLLSGCDDKTLRLLNSTWGQVWSTSSSHSSNVTSVAFSADGASFISGSLDRTLRLCSTNGSLVRLFSGHAAGVNAVALSADGSRVASGSVDGSVKIWNKSTGACLATIAAHDSPVTSVSFTPDSSAIISGGEDAAVRLWSVSSGALVTTLGEQTDYVAVVAISPDGLLCANAGGGGVISIRRTSDGAPLLTLPGHSNQVNALAFGPDSALLASGGGPLDSTIKLWDLKDGNLLRTIAAASNGVTALAYSPDGSLLASGADCSEQTISIWDAGTGLLVRSLDGHSSGVTALAFSPRGDLLASGGRWYDHVVKIWAVTNGALLSSFTGHSNNIEALAFAPDGNSLASGSSGTGNLKVWQLSDGACRDFGASASPVFAVGFSPDGTTLASAESGAIKLWNAASGALSETATQNTFRASCLAYSPNGNLLFIGREDATVALFSNTRGAFGREPLAFTAFTPPSAGDAGFTAAVAAGTHYVIQSSTDLSRWDFVLQAASASNSLSISGLAITNGDATFLRALTPP